MNNIAKKRNCIKEKRYRALSGRTKQIHVPIEKEEYMALIGNSRAFKNKLNSLIVEYPELFPQGIQHGYKLHGYQAQSKKMPEIRCRRIQLKYSKDTYSILPCFVMTYMRGYTKDFDKPMFLRKFGVPYWALTYVFGRDDMYWYRAECSLGRNSIVGTTIRDSENLPKNILADEKFTWHNGDQIYWATTTSGDCILGSHLAEFADHLDLVHAYGVFKKEAQNISPDYSPETVTTDAWKATRWAWQTLFPSVCLILCYLHSYLKIKNHYKQLGEHASVVCEHVWEAFDQKTERLFRAKIGFLKLYALICIHNNNARKAVLKLCDKVDLFAQAYHFPDCYRTTANLDRLMDLQDRYVYSCKYFHGHDRSAQFLVRSFALIHNFSPYCPRANLSFLSPAHRINKSVYHNNWLTNLHISASMGGCFQ